MPENGKNRTVRRLRAGAWQLRHRLSRADVRSQLILWPIAVAIGIATGYAVILFRGGISWLQSRFYGPGIWCFRSRSWAGWWSG
jgi:hypothetical protein